MLLQQFGEQQGDAGNGCCSLRPMGSSPDSRSLLCLSDRQDPFPHQTWQDFILVIETFSKAELNEKSAPYSLSSSHAYGSSELQLPQFQKDLMTSEVTSTSHVLLL